MPSTSFTVALARTSGTLQVATVTVKADTAAGAGRLALEMLADDSADVAWTNSADSAATANGTAHITSVVAAKAP